MDHPGVYIFDEISTAELFFALLKNSFKKIFFFFFFNLKKIPFDGLCFSSSLSSSRAASTDLPDPFSPLVSIVHHSREVFEATPCIDTELLYIGSSWSSWLCSSIWRGSLEYIAYEFVLTFPAVSHISRSSNLDSFLIFPNTCYFSSIQSFYFICCFSFPSF